MKIKSMLNGLTGLSIAVRIYCLRKAFSVLEGIIPGGQAVLRFGHDANKKHNHDMDFEGFK